ncbi:ABC transporter permease [Kineosporia sp. R_H_3]|uniref:ABC transporter permease n=1 Tax=Kineosporia sp. R_H_3 TaxID=1961848 RepID=UPI000B4AC65A|nr:ABC transporter permease [Kineosporia sp. R_H_3]
MSLTNERAGVEGAVVHAPEHTPARRSGARTAVYAVVAVLVILSVTRQLSGANDITSSGTAGAALRLAVPILLAGLAGLWSERAGVVNIGLEGMMVLGTWCGAYGALNYGPWVGLLAGIAGGALGGLVHAVATVTFGVDHIVSGVAINLLGPGIARFLSALIFTGSEGGGVTQSPQIEQPGKFTVPGLSDALLSVEGHHWFLVSDVAGVLGGFVTGVSWVTLLGVLLVPATAFVLWRTRFGLRLRSCGENPYAAESLGVNVYLYKYLAVVISGGFAGLGGAFLSLVASNFYREGQTGGRGFIGLAAMIFGNWRPGGLLAGAGLFGFTDALQLRQGETSVHALFLALAIGLALFGGWLLYSRKVVGGAASLVVAALVLALYLLTDTVPQQFTTATPYVTTLLVLALASQRLRMPAADGLVYRRGTAK